MRNVITRNSKSKLRRNSGNCARRLRCIDESRHSGPETLTRTDMAIEAGSRAFIEPMSGFGSYLSAAIEKKHAPLVIVASEDKADFVITEA
jgi:hypothetical protein